MPQDQPVVTGKAAIRPLYEAVLNEFDFQSEGTVKEVVVSGDVGYFWSAYALTATPKAGGDPMKVTGKSLFIVRREPGGAWKITRLMDNSDGVATGQDTQQKG
jgi:ketosteroid isomerase-like protein